MFLRLLLAAGFLTTAVPARAELLKFEETAAGLRVTLKIDGRNFELEPKIARPARQKPGAALLVDAEPGADLTPLALSRGMTVISPDLGKLPNAMRAQAIRDLLPRLRETIEATRVLGRGRGEGAAALVDAASLFDGLLLEDVPKTPASAGRSPRVIETWGADAYWRTTPRAAPNGPEPQNRRSFYLAGIAAPGAAGDCGAPVNARSGAPALRGLFVALDEWTKGTKPPASRAPGVADLAPARALVWPKIPSLPPAPGGERLVPKIDDDGNELSGLRLPDQALPIATFTGFNAQKDKAGPPCVAGATLPFPASKAEREKAADPRPSLVERYGSRAYFVATMRVVADKLVKERLLLREDADAYVTTAKAAPF